MAISQSLPTDCDCRTAKSSLARPLAPEDVRRGDFVAVMQYTYELPSYLWCADSFLIPHDQPVRVNFLPPDGNLPMKVRAVCLPFVLVKTPDGQQQMLDVRRHRLARLDRRFGRAAWKEKGEESKG